MRIERQVPAMEPLITNYFRACKNKRRHSGDEESAFNKLVVLETKTEKPTPTLVPLTPKARVVTRLTFDSDPVTDPVSASASASASAPPPVPAPLPDTLLAPEIPAPPLSLSRIRKAISSSSRRDDLKARLAKFRSNYDKLNAPVAKTPEKVLQKFDSIELQIQTSPVKLTSPIKRASPFTSPVKNLSPLRNLIKSPTKIPAYLRYESSVSTSQSLQLPHHYKFLGEVFRAVETACSMLVNRKETPTFSKVKPAAQDMLKRNVTEKHLSQIKHLCPHMYTFNREKLKNMANTSRKDEYELVMIPNIVDSKTGCTVNTMSAENKIARQRAFYNVLVETLKMHHERFLLTLDPPMIISRDKLTRWHPEFDLEHVPEVESEPLPSPPNPERYTTARDMLSKANDMFNTRLQNALERAVKNRIENPVSDDKMKSSPNPQIKIINPALMNIPNALLEKVRARQAEKALKDMTRSTMDEENIMTYQRLPDLARIVNNVFVSEKRGVLPVDKLLNKLEHSLSTFNMSSSTILNHLKVLSKEKPEWLEFNTIRKVDYMKINKSISFTKIISSLETLANKNST